MKPSRNDHLFPGGKCPRCGGKARFQVEAFLDCDGALINRISKKAIGTRAVQLLGAGWPTVHWYCPGPCK